MSTGTGRRICPYCQIPLTSADNVRVCPLCHMPHHVECWRENGGCTTFGCSGDPTRVPTWVSAPPRQQGPADSIDLTADDAVVCHHCGHAMSLLEDTCPACGASADALPAPPARLQVGMRYQYRRIVKKSPAAACLLNLLLLGAGYFYLGKVGKGLLILFLGLVAGFGTCWFGAVVVLIYAMVDCYHTATEMNRV